MNFFDAFIVQVAVMAVVALGSLILQVAMQRRQRRRLDRITQARISAEVQLRLVTAAARAAMRRAAREARKRRR